ncbi:DUF167 domain-containing protein [Thiovibrio sp. JS02]
MSFLKERADGTVSIAFYVQPKASRTRISGLHADALKLSITAPPVDGKANEAVIRFVAKLFKIPKSAVSIESGETSRSKVLRLRGVSAAEAQRLLQPLLAD